MSFSSDWLFPPFQSQEMVNALIAAGKPVSYCNVQSNCGHDAFLLADELPIYGETDAGLPGEPRRAADPGPSARWRQRPAAGRRALQLTRTRPASSTAAAWTTTRSSS